MLTKNEEWVLKKARARIAAKKEDYICSALIAVALLHPQQEKACNRMRKFIELKLNGNCTLCIWQMNTGRGIRSRTQLRSDRLNWIDWMLGRL
jgi:hypothetical protein